MDIALVSVTAMSLAMALAMGIVAWRVIREERLRSDARVAALLVELERTRGTASAGSSPVRARADVKVRPDRLPVAPPPDALDDEPPASAAGWRGPLLAAVAATFVVVAVVTIAIQPGGAPPDGGATQATPVELLSLGHARQGEYLAIAGSVRNPADGVDRGRLSVMATVFDEAGTQIGTGQTPLPVRALPPGTETPFTISMPDGDRINRYRISFAQDQTAVPHVDLRQTATTPAVTASTAGGQP